MGCQHLCTIAALTIALMGVCGCSGSGHLFVAALDFKSIDPPAAAPTEIHIDEAYWWAGDDGKLFVALQRRIGTPSGPFGEYTIRLILKLGEPPAGKARNYTLNPRDAWIAVTTLPIQGRYLAGSGIVALYREPNDQYRGTFRLLASRATTGLLGGWNPAGRYLVTGTFTAVPSAERGAEILRSASDVLDGEPPSASQPAVEQ